MKPTPPRREGVGSSEPTRPPGDLSNRAVPSIGQERVEFTPPSDPRDDEGPRPAGTQLVRVALVFYGLLFAIAVGWEALSGGSLFYATAKAQQLGVNPLRDSAAGVLAGGVAVLLSREFTRRTTSGNVLARALASTLGPLTMLQCIVLAVTSGVAEEALFRGVLQPRVGLVAASLIFGLMHFLPRREYAVWTATTIVAGFMLGILFEATGNLIAPTLAHVVVNAMNLRWLAVNFVTD